MLLPPVYDPVLIRSLAASLNIAEMGAALLLQRDLTTEEGASHFLFPDLTRLHDPFLFPDMEKAVARIAEALRGKEKICIYGDYDVDGITAVALLVRTLQDLSAEVEWYIPDRLKEGYGLSDKGIQDIHTRGVGLIVTVDCGITADQEIALARSLGMDVIVTDHHLSRDPLPEAVALINPKLPGSPYPDKDLSGVGVAFKLASALQQRFYHTDSASEHSLPLYLDLVTIGTLADVVPLLGENRILVHAGLDQLKRSGCEGVKALLLESGLYGKPMTGSAIAFSLTPLINAAGRLGEPAMALRLFLTSSTDEAKTLARELKGFNVKRKALDQAITEECIGRIEASPILLDSAFLVLASDQWHPGVMGIVASRLMERYGRPALLLSIENGVARGSARSIPAFHVLDAITTCRDLLIDFGGHRLAAGVEIREDNIPVLSDRLNRFAQTALSGQTLLPVVQTDLAFSDLDALDWETLHLLKRFEPFGAGNQKPLFYVPACRVMGSPRLLNGGHLKFRVSAGRTTFDAIAFRMGHRLNDLVKGPVTLAFHAEENEWNGQKNIQLNVRGIA
ncbi:MAG: single-stranded-DNA-specific exonuclease RecJ [Elusimicrobia bacterium RIFOXYB2_FULL_49_7]|nr:MAG: single-stranded-DNA-specific exonuclease RecJ [Elusimicrobia bacterium RIFOXYB2_FULL_49_7]